MRNLKFFNQRGQSLLEIIIALAIFALIGSFMAPFIVGSFVGLERGGEQTQAEALAQEGIEAVRSIRDGAWNEIFYNQSAVIIANSGQWIFDGEGTTEQIGQFTRTITFDDVCRNISDEIVPCPGNYTDAHSKKTTVVVNWEPTIGATNFVQQVAYLTNWDSQEWIQTDWLGGSGQSVWFNQTKYLTDNNINISTTGEIKLKIVGVAGYGSGFIINNVSGAGKISKEDYQISLRFKAQNSKTVNAIRVYLEHEKTSPTYRYGLQSDNNGEPSGIWLGNNNQAYGDYRTTSDSWKIINLNEQATLIANTTYHLVVYYQPPDRIGGQHAVELRRSDPNNFMYPYDSSPDPSSNILWSGDGGLSWSVQEYQPIYVLDFLDGTHEGNPYHEIAVHEIYSNFYFGEQLTITGTDKRLSEISFLVSENNQGPEDNLYVTVYDVTSSEQIEHGVLATDDDTINTEYSWEIYTLPSPLTLIVGNTYRVYLSSPLSDIQQHFQTRSVYHDNIVDLNEINYDGINSYFITSNDNGDTWNTTNLNHDIGGFYFNKSIYETSGELISSAFDTGSPSKLQIIEWDEVISSCNPACEIKMQIQTAPDNSGSPGTWSAWCGFEGKDGDETDYFTNSNGELIHTDHNDDQWIRYKTILTGDSTDTPILEEIRANYK